MATEITVGELVSLLRAHPDRWLIGIAGIPGAGKSTLAAMLAERLPKTVVVPMDGYHLPRRSLNAEGLRRRGSPPTFDPKSFRADLSALRKTRTGHFPGWNHAAKDPAPGAIQIEPETKRVIVEGNYLLLDDWDLTALFDVTIFLDCPVDVAMERVESRLVDCGIAPDRVAARARVGENDRLNAETILADGCRERADFVVAV